VTVKIGACVRCGRPVGIKGRQHCARCHYALAHRPGKHSCPGCGKNKILDAATGKCVLCSRTCTRCGHRVGRIGRELCKECTRRDRRTAAQQPCPRCGKPGRIRPETGWCGPCSHPGRPPNPDAACQSCGTVTHLIGAGLCSNCYDRSPHRVIVRAENLAADLGDPPGWLPGFADYLTTRHHAARACQFITVLGRLLREVGPLHPQALLERAGQANVPLAKALEDFFIRHGLALPPDRDERRAAQRRRRRLDAIPPSLRPAAEAFAEHELNGRHRAQRAGTRPRQHATIEAHLTAVRDLAVFLAKASGITDWATVSAGDIEAFLATQPATTAHRLAGLRRFFRFAVHRHLILTNPAKSITAAQPQGFRGPTLTRNQQRELFRRWTTGSGGGVHPHEAAVGLLALIHGATTQELQHLTLDAIDRTPRPPTCPDARTRPRSTRGRGLHSNAASPTTKHWAPTTRTC
jgi:hypothetical protein